MVRFRLLQCLFALRIYRLRHVFCFPCLALNFCSRRGRVRFRAFASIPGRVYACSRSPGSSTRLCAVIHLCEGQGVAGAAWLGSAWAGQFRWVGSLGIEVAGPWSCPGIPRRFSVSSGCAGVSSFVSRRSGKICRLRKIAGRAVERTPAWVEGAFADSPKT